MSMPRATVRLQFNSDFTFDAAIEVLPYLARLGISHIYASPILAARPGSTHGYDTIDPTAINPELGGRVGLERLSAALRRHDMGLIVDIVPNHMAAVAENPWWWDVLKSGRASRYGDFFDIDWADPDPELTGKILLPCLGDTLEACLDRGEITLEDTGGGRAFRYFDQRFPIDPRTAAAGDDLPRLLQGQNYLLAFWREAATRINWRRFFDINHLVALRMESDAVFDAYHGLILALVRENLIDGLRVDHVDGLAEPIAYCGRLRAQLQAAAPNRELYLVVEKILESEETLSDAWPVHGTTGYDFMDQVSAVLHDPDGEAALMQLWQDVSQDRRTFHALAADARREILERLFPGQRDHLIVALRAADSAKFAPFTDAMLRKALTGLLAAMRRYRFYGDESGFEEADVARPALDAEAAAARAAICAVLPKPPVRQRFAQLSATLAAKAVEDTAFYRYGRLLSRNEVGADPGRLALSVQRFHECMALRCATFPAAMLATATHDHKRGEDSRARLAVLTELPDDWAARVKAWRARYPAPDPAVAAMIYQTVIGAWPPGLDVGDPAALDGFRKRLEQWLVKALREAKLRTAWDNPDEAFERGCLDYLAALLEPRGAFLKDVEGFVARIAPAAVRNSLAQTVLRLTVPGVPDLYQGTEFWDFSLVDPDNRSPVDFDARRRALSDEEPVNRRQIEGQDGRIKQAVIARLLGFRRDHPRLFSDGTYEPLKVSGPGAGHLIGFLRRHADEALIVLVPRLTMGLPAGGVWQETAVQIPASARGPGRDLFRSGKIQMRETADAASLLDELPLAAIYVRGP
jgi:malto-oligosyltrehalose synthase